MVFDATATDAEIARELAEFSKPRNTFYSRDAAEIYAADNGVDTAHYEEDEEDEDPGMSR